MPRLFSYGLIQKFLLRSRVLVFLLEPISEFLILLYLSLSFFISKKELSRLVSEMEIESPCLTMSLRGETFWLSANLN